MLNSISVKTISKLFLSNAGVLIINLLTGIITARALGSEQRGEQSTAIFWIYFIALSTTFGLPSSLIYNSKKDASGESDYIYACIASNVVLGAIFSVLAAQIFPIMLKTQRPEFVSFMILMSPFVAIESFRVTAMSVLQLKEEFNKISLIKIFTPLLSLAVLIVLVYMEVIDTFTSTLAMLVPGIISIAYMIKYIVSNFRTNIKDVIGAFSQISAYASRAAPIDMFSMLSTQADRLFLVGLVSPQTFGYYMVALSSSRVFGVFSVAINTYLLPKVSGQNVEVVRSLTFRLFFINLFLGAISIIFVFIAGGELIYLVYGEDFAGAVAIFKLLTLEIALSSSSSIIFQALLALNRPQTVSKIQIIATFITITAMLLTVKKFGVLGAAGSYATSSALALALGVYYLYNGSRSKNERR